MTLLLMRTSAVFHLDRVGMRRERWLVILLLLLAVGNDDAGGSGTSLNNSTKCNEKRQGKGPSDCSFSELLLEKNLELLAPTAATTENDMCRRQAMHYAKAVREGVEWAVQMLDAGSKTPLNLVSGRGFHLGRYDACVTLENIPTPDGPISGQHCVVAVGPPRWYTQSSVYQRIILHVRELEGKLRLASRKEFQGSHTRDEPGFVWSLCVPASCSPGDVRRHLVSVLPTLVGGNNTRSLVGSVECTSHADDQSFTPQDWLFVAIIVVLVSLIIVGTCRDFLPTDEGWKPDVLGAFSLRRGARQLFHVAPRRPDTDHDVIPALDGIRVVTMMSLFVYHHESISKHFPPAPFPARAYEDEIWRFRSWFACLLHVDTFALLGGLLVCWNYLREQQRGAKFKLLSFYFQRVVRLGPLFWLGVLLMKSNLSYYITEGPLFKVNMQQNQQNCAENLLQVLFFLGNYLPSESMCGIHAWYVAVDMQLYLLAPLFIIPLHSWPVMGKYLIGSFLLVSVILAYAVTSNYELFYLGLPYGLNMELVWFHAHMRLTPWLIGIGVGYVLHVTACSPIQLPRLQVTAAWILTTAMMSTALFLGPVVLAWEDRWWTLLFVNTQRPMWSFGLAWVVFACSKGYGGNVTSVLSWRGFVVPSRLSYAFYLCHVAVIGLIVSAMKNVGHFNTGGSVMYVLRDLVASVLVATVSHLVVVLPATNLWKVLVSSDRKPTKQKEN